ncbi:MAG TPA: ATP-binding cassette domain-containing protein, partial [Actinomycetota bacterium]|nr:ATP-binding cassette domain-containing protein [Actinomycetota bacterium]
ISHDRDFMNAMATRIVEIERGLLISYTGDYAAFVEQREMRAQQADAAAAQQQRKIAQVERFIERFRYKNTKAKQVQSRVKMLDKMDRIEQPTERRKAMGIGLPKAPRAGRVVLELSGVDFSYGDRPVYRGLDIAIERGQKVALVGPNGAGKTTLLKLLAGALEPQGGERRVGVNVALGYFAQHQIEALDLGARVIEEVERVLPPGGPIRPRDLLGRFLFSGDDAEKPVRVLSGGERTRLAMAKMLASARNVLCLDEPTNHLDIWSRDALEDALDNFDGAIVLITHDRHLIRSIADTIIEVIDGRARVFPGDYESYLASIEQEQLVPTSSKGAATAPTPAKERRKQAAEERARESSKRNAIRSAERELEKIHAELQVMNERMAQPDFYTTEHDVAGFMRTYDERRARVAELEREWDRLTEEAQ